MITLAQLEQETARRVGPYLALATDSQVPSTATSTSALFPELQSTVLQDVVPNLWLLRRSAGAADRQRLVASVDPGRGQGVPDRPWQQPPTPGEVCEFHHLNPDQELRPAVLAGLRRCYMINRGQFQPSGAGSVDLTASAPWLINPNQVLRMQAGWPGRMVDLAVPMTVQGGHVVADVASGAYYGWIYITALRPHISWVNGLESTGPTADADTLDVDLDYAASAAHIEAWHASPARLQAAAAGGLQASQSMAANEFSRQAWIWRARTPDRYAFDQPFSI